MVDQKVGRSAVSVVGVVVIVGNCCPLPALALVPVLVPAPAVDVAVVVVDAVVEQPIDS